MKTSHISLVLRLVCLSFLALAPSVHATPINDQELDRFLDQVPLEAALVVDQNDTLRRLLASDANLRLSLSNLKERPTELMDFVGSLNTRHAPSRGHSPQTLWEQEYNRFLEVRRNSYSTTDTQAIQTWTNGIVSTWSPGARRRIVSKVRTERDRHQAAYLQTQQGIPGEVQRGREASAAIPGLEAQAAAEAERARAYQAAHAKWNDADWTRFAKGVGITTAIGAALPGAFAYFASGRALGTAGLWAAGGAVALAAISALWTRSNIDGDHENAAAEFTNKAQSHNQQVAANRGVVTGVETRVTGLRDRARASRQTAEWNDQLLDVIPQGRLWDRGLPPVAEEGPGMDGIERTP